jgi:tetratricopeptide (TPR) repeat protein
VTRIEDDVDEALRLVDVNPSAALSAATAIDALASSAGDLDTASRAARVSGLASFHLVGVAAALPHLRRAVLLARRAGAARSEGLARMSLAGQLSYAGRPAAALREIERAHGLLDGADRLTSGTQRGLILWRSGRLDEALDVYADVLVGLRSAGDDVGTYTLLVNRGALLLERLRLAAAEKDLVEASELASKVGDGLSDAYARANLGFVHLLRGDVPGALAELSEAELRLRAAGGRVGDVLSFRAEALLAVRLVREARTTATEALEAFRREGNATAVALTQLVVAQIALMDVGRRPGAVQETMDHAAAAIRDLRRVRREDQVPVARLVGLRAAASDPSRRGAVRLGDVERAAARAAQAGWFGPAVDGWLLGYELARSTRPARALTLLEAATALRSGRRPADLRARGWYAEGLRRAHLDDPQGAERAALRGLQILDEFRDALPATDVRAHAAAHRRDLAELGTSLALRSGDPRRVLRWAEHGRATGLVVGSVRPPSDSRLAERMVVLRKAVLDLYEGRTSNVPPARIERLRARVTVLEKEIRDLARGGTGAGEAPGVAGTARPAAVAELGAALRDRALVEYVVHDGSLFAVTLVSGHARLQRLGAVADVAGLVERIPFAVQRMTRASRSPGGAAAAQALLADAARRLDDILLAPLPETAGRDLVVVPTGVLQAMPWSVLPSCHGRPVTVAPSATVWLAATGRSPAPGAVLVAAGPRLRSAAAEAHAVAALHGTVPLIDPHATVDAVTAALPGASLAHLATHGRLSAENPLFSHLLLSDGPLVVYDLERLESLPHTVVLAACESGRHVVPAGDELLGLGAAFLAGGTAQLVASVVPVPDAETRELMTDLHTRLVAGEPPAVALAAAQATLADAGPVAAATAAGFVCIGAGFVPVSRPTS